MKRHFLIMLLMSLLLIFCGGYVLFPMTVNMTQLIILRRVIKLVVMLMVAASVSVSTISFQTIIGNRYLTPSVLGVESLFVLMQTILYIGERLLGITTSPSLAIALLSLVMQGGAFLFVYQLFRRVMQFDVQVVLLVSLALGMLFRSVTTFIQVLLDPNEYDQLQAKLFPSFQRMNSQPQLVILMLVLMLIFILVLTFHSHILDVFHLGESQAFLLGVQVEKLQWWLMLVIVLLSTVSTILVGPMMFLGFIVANVTYQLVKDYRHRVLWGLSFLIGANLLIGGQWIAEKMIHLNFPISIIIEWLGGLLYLFLVLKGGAKNETLSR